MSAEHNHLAEIHLTVNGRSITERVSPCLTLREFLHSRLGIHDVKYGCGEGVCGACLVLVDGEPVASCLMLAAQAEERRVVTAAGLESADAGLSAERFRSLREHLLAREAFQCGYCACGMLVAAAYCLSSDKALSPKAIRETLSGNICRCTGYKQIEEAIAAAATGQAADEVKNPREDLRLKLEARADYLTDVRIKDALAGRVLWSEWPSARITRIDTREAESVPGVEAVLTYKDIPGRNLAGTTVFIKDQPLLAVDRVRYLGEAVALVAARTEIAAREAVRRIRVTYEPLDAVNDVLDAIKPGAPQVGRRGNVIAQLTEIKGDIEAAFREADALVEGTYRCTIVDHACMELTGGIGWFENDTLVLQTSTQTPHTIRRSIARALRMPEERVRIVTSRIGGSFGKYLAPSMEDYLALLVYKTRKAVRLVLDREEVLARTTKRHPFVGHYRLGLKPDGSFIAMEADILTDAGPYASLTPAVVSIFAAEAAGAYEIPNLKVRARGILTNNLLPAPMRGFGSQQINFGIECIVEKAARQLGLDSGELRRRNYQSTRADGRGHEIPGAEVWLAKTMDRVEQRLGPRPQPPPGWLIGRGVASIHAKYGYPYGMLDRFTARVSVDSAGHFIVESDLSDAGSGVVAGVPRLVAQYLGLDETPQYMRSQAAIDDPSGALFSQGRRPSWLRARLYRLIERLQTMGAGQLQSTLARLDAASVSRLLRLFAYPTNFANSFINWVKAWFFPYGLDSYNPRISGSRSMFMVGRAALNAAERLKDSALAMAARALDSPTDSLEVKGAGVAHRSDPARRITWAELARRAGGRLTAIGEAHLPRGWLINPANGNQIGPVDFTYASHGCDIAVHPGTGAVRILLYVACHDVGRALNPEIIRGQLLGGIAMGIGQALFEHIVTDGGKVQTAGLHDYLVPSILDLPTNVEIEILESKSGLGPDGAKGVGEAGAEAAPIAIINALYDAIGAQPICIPITPEEIVNLYEQSAKGAERAQVGNW